jgi:hypothetical protein
MLWNLYDRKKLYNKKIGRFFLYFFKCLSCDFSQFKKKIKCLDPNLNFFRSMIRTRLKFMDSFGFGSTTLLSRYIKFSNNRIIKIEYFCTGMWTWHSSWFNFKFRNVRYWVKFLRYSTYIQSMVNTDNIARSIPMQWCGSEYEIIQTFCWIRISTNMD